MKPLEVYVLIPVAFDDSLMLSVRPEDPPAQWRETPPHSSTQQLGDEWVAERRSVVLRVPGAIVPDESNYVINPASGLRAHRHRRSAGDLARFPTASLIAPPANAFRPGTAPAHQHRRDHALPPHRCHCEMLHGCRLRRRERNRHAELTTGAAHPPRVGDRGPTSWSTTHAASVFGFTRGGARPRAGSRARA
jgi:hypothetical protein